MFLLKLGKFSKPLLTCLFLAATGAAQAQELAQLSSPVSNPVNFEDPRILSEVRPVYVHHDIDSKFVTQGGSVDIYAMQLRVALTDNLAFIATKDGYVKMKPDSVLKDESGFANLAGGFKYSIYNCEDTIVTTGLRYEAPTGEKEVLQGNGDGIINPFLSAATSAGGFNFMGYTAVRAAIDQDDSTFYDASLHVDKKLGWFSPLVELNLFNVLDAGHRLPIEDEGQDFFNIGYSLSQNETMLTTAVGARAELSDDVSLGLAYEFPLVTGSGSYITEWRLTSDLIYRF